MAEKKKTRGLGRGLSALMADVTPEKTESTQRQAPDRSIPIERIVPNPDQPRRRFAESHLAELAESIKTKGVIQPLIVRPRAGADGEYEIVAGERRWRAAQIAQLHELPVLIRDFDDTEVLEVAIIENIQRADLNPIEEAAGYRQLMEKFGHTQEKLAEALGKSRSHIANLLRLLTLPDTVQTMVQTGDLSAGHARTLITSDTPLDMAKRIVAEGLSVRDAERLVKMPAKPKSKAPTSGRVKTSKDADTKALEGELSAALGLKVTIDHIAGHDGGTMVLRYKSFDQLDDLCARLTGDH